jgi:hypothetical protein
MRILDTMKNLVDGFQGRLTESIDHRAGYLSEVDCPTDTMLDVERLTEPLV